MDKDKDPFWKEAYDRVQQQLRELRAERDERVTELDELNHEIVQLEQLEHRIIPFIGTQAADITTVEGVSELGLADAVREVLKQSSQFRTARGIRDSLDQSAYPLNKMHANPLASIHGILKRLKESGEVEVLETEGKTRYRWKATTPNSFKMLPMPRRRPNAFQELAERVKKEKN